MARYKLEDLQQKLIKLMDHEKVLKECLEMVRGEKTKLHIERLQIESMMDDLKLIQCKKFKPSSRFNPFLSSIDLSEDGNEDDTEDMAGNIDFNEQELQLDVSKTLHDMMMGTYEDALDNYEGGFYEEEDDDDEDDDDDDDD